MKTLKVVDFIRANPDNWKELLTASPHSLSIKENGNYVLFAYSQIDSDFSNPLVQECRGLILNSIGWRAVCVPFFKFFNVQEGHAVKVDWNNCKVLEKLDGSIIKLWFDNKWRISTNGTIDANDAGLSFPVTVTDYYKKLETYHDLFMYAVKDLDLKRILRNLDKSMTYMFELTSPYNRIVVPYTETKLFHIGTRSNYDLTEVEYDIPEFDKPKIYNISTLEQCLSTAERLPFSEEGYVVVDHKYNRVKIKGISYVSAHHLRNNGVVTYKRVIEMILASGQDDFLSIYPEYKDIFDDVLNSMYGYLNKLSNDENNRPDGLLTRKDYAMWAKTTANMNYFFGVLDGKWSSPQQWMWSLSPDKISELIGKN